MGFFSDLKEDLSQAVNELMPEEELNAVLSDDANTPETASENDQPAEAGALENTAGKEEMPSSESVESFDLSSMLDKLDDIGIDEPVEEETLSTVEEVTSGAEETPVSEAAEPAFEQTITEPAFEQAVTEPEPIEEPVMNMTDEAASYQKTAMIPQEAEDVSEERTTVNYNGEEEKRMDVQTNRVAVDETAVVTEGMTITGDIISEGSMELIGTVNGNLDILGKLNITGAIQGNSKAAEIYAEGAKITGEVNSLGSVKIGQSSVVIGNISATSAVIAGAVKGDIDVHGPVILDTTAIVMGNIKSKSVQINNGAVIEGLCSQCYADVNPTSFFEEFKKKK